MTTNTYAALADAVRVPLDSLHADAEYLCARLLDKSLTREEVVTAIRFRIDAAKAVLTTAAAVPVAGWVMVPVEPTEEMIIAGVDASLRVADAWLGGDDSKNPHVARWFAMLASAPKAEPVQAGEYPPLPGDPALGLVQYTAMDVRKAIDADRAMRAQAATAAVAHIQQPFTLAEIKAKIASNDYSAELMLQHAMLLLEKPDAVAGPREAVAYLDIGGGGYLDLGSDLSDEALRKLPKGRNMLAIVGTYGVDGYVPVATPTTQAAPQPAVQQGDALPAIKGVSISGGYVIVTPAGWGDDKTQRVREAILHIFPANPVYTPNPGSDAARSQAKEGDAP